MAFEKQLKGTGVTRKGDPNSQVPALTQWWLEEDDVLTGQPLHPVKYALQIFTDASKEGWGAHLNEHTARGTWSFPESKLHINYLELKAVFLALKEFQDLKMCSQNNSCSNRQHHSGVMHKQGGRHEVGPTLCPTVENLDFCVPENKQLSKPDTSQAG